MNCKMRRWTAVAAALAVAACLGCSKPEPGGGPAAPEDQPGAAADTPVDSGAPAVTTQAPAEPAPPPTIPKVVLSESLAATCLVKTSDPMPKGQLLDLEGKGQPLEAFFGPKLTVVLFWTSRNMYSGEALAHVSRKVAAPFAAKGLRVVTVNEGDTPEVVLQAIETLDPKLPSLLDPDGQFLAKVASERPLRPYLLDSQGKILWFDIEYSESTRRDLVQSIRVALGEI